MLQKIIIKNLAIIDDAEIQLSDSLNIITGETGSGKSLIVNAIDLLMGAKFSKDNFRDDKEIQLIGHFCFDNKDVEIKRIFSHSGNHKTFINKKQTTNQELKKVTRNYIDMHSQYNQHSIFDKAIHIDYLDIFGDYSDLLVDMHKAFDKYENNRKKIIELMKMKDDVIEKRKLYKYQLSELNEIDLYENVDDDLSQKYDKISNVEKVKKTIDDILNIFDSDQVGLKTILLKSIKLIEDLDSIDDDFGKFNSILENIKIDIGEIGYDLELKKNEYVFDSNQFNKISEELEHVQMVKRKYGGTIQSAISYKNKIEAYLGNYSNIDEEINVLNKTIKKDKKTINYLADKISNKRLTNIPMFEKSINQILGQLNMEDAVFSISLTKTDKIYDKGYDRCEFHIRTNKGSEIKPVVKIASGGEISRIMLAIKILMQNKIRKNTLIFDEIDLGVSGKAAENLGSNLLKLSNKTQVVCISHLPQVASKGNHHYKVFKETNKNLTFSKIVKLNSESRINEIAQMLSGKEITDNSLKQAKYLLRM
tara:strand:- start:479 stop:2083 length:1605 start_codon:yes stop_codon:yes gene_type:complete